MHQIGLIVAVKCLKTYSFECSSTTCLSNIFLCYSTHMWQVKLYFWKKNIAMIITHIYFWIKNIAMIIHMSVSCVTYLIYKFRAHAFLVHLYLVCQTWQICYFLLFCWSCSYSPSHYLYSCLLRDESFYLYSSHSHYLLFVSITLSLLISTTQFWFISITLSLFISDSAAGLHWLNSCSACAILAYICLWMYDKYDHISVCVYIHMLVPLFLEIQLYTDTLFLQHIACIYTHIYTYICCSWMLVYTCRLTAIL